MTDEQLSNLVVNELRRTGAKPSTHYVGLDRAALMALRRWSASNDPYGRHLPGKTFCGFEVHQDLFAPGGVVLIRRLLAG